MKKSLSIALFPLVLASCNANNSLDIPFTKDGIEIINDNFRNYYEIFVGSFADSNGDKIGDLNGITQKLDYIQDLGYTGIWLTPIFKSHTYHKYDCDDYYEIDPSFGSMDDFKNLLNEAHSRDIKVIIDLVMNHSSGSNQLFEDSKDAFAKSVKGESLTEKEEIMKDFYSFKLDQKDFGTRVSNGTTRLGVNFYYECNFDTNMPEFNFDNPHVYEYFNDVMKYYLELGVDGFRLDAIKYYYLNATENNLEVLKKINTYAKSIKSDCYIVGECFDGEAIVKEYAKSEIDSVFYFPSSQADGFIAKTYGYGGNYYDAYLRGISKMESYTKNHIPAPFLSNHDVSRLNTDSDLVKNKFYYGLLSMLKGTTFTYYGDEIGMVGTLKPDQNVRIMMNWGEKNQYNCNHPKGTEKAVYPNGSVESQIDDPLSQLNYYKKANWLRNKYPSISRSNMIDYYEDEENSLIIIDKEYKDEKIGILINFNVDQKVEISLEETKYSEVIDYLLVDETKPELINNKLTIPSKGIAILK